MMRTEYVKPTAKMLSVSLLSPTLDFVSASKGGETPGENDWGAKEDYDDMDGSVWED